MEDGRKRASPGMKNQVISLDSPSNSSEREAKRPCRSFSSILEESDMRDTSSQEIEPTKEIAPVEVREYSRRRKDVSRQENTLVTTTSEWINHQYTELVAAVEEMELQIAEILKLRRTSLKEKLVGVTVIDEDREKAIVEIKRQRSNENAKREANHAKRAGDLMRICGNIIRQVTAHKWAWPFMQPVDVEGLQLHDYYDVIKKPMDFGTIRDKMDSKDGDGYKDVLEIAEDVRLVFSNAMTYNEAGTDVYVMAKTLSEKFEEKWKTALEPKLLEEEARKKELVVKEISDAEQIKVAEEFALERMAQDICKKMNNLDDLVEDLKTQTILRCRSMTVEEKRHLGTTLSRLPSTSLNRVVQIIAKGNPRLNTSTSELEVDIDAMDTGTLWQLHSYAHIMLTTFPKQNEVPEPLAAPPASVKRRPVLNKVHK